MKHIDEIYKEWCGESHLVNSGHPVHDSAECTEFSEYYGKHHLTAQHDAEIIAFAEYVGKSFFGLGGGYFVHKYNDATNKANWITTTDLLSQFRKGGEK